MKFRLYWRDGKTEIVVGKNIADAMNARGYGHGALPALDFYSRGEKNTYTFVPVRGWVQSIDKVTR